VEFSYSDLFPAEAYSFLDNKAKSIGSSMGYLLMHNTALMKSEVVDLKLVKKNSPDTTNGTVTGQLGLQNVMKMFL